MSGALQGIKVLDLTRVLAGPLCTMILGDLGAEIIKVEAPGQGDDTRNWGPPFQNDVSAYYLCANRNKKSINVDLKTEEGKEIIKKLVKESDVVIHNFKTGTMERFGMSYGIFKTINPGIVFCSITGFGENGPYKHLAGYDYIIQAMSGLMSITGAEESGPQKVGVAIIDILTGLYACIGIQAALLEKKQSGTGQSLDISLFDAGISALVNIASNYLMSGEIPKQLGGQHANIVPYQTFRTLDGKIVLAVGNDTQFTKFCAIIGQSELAKNPIYATNKKRVENSKSLVKLLQAALSKEKTEYWQKVCNEQGIPCGPINTLQQVFEDPQVLARDMIIKQAHPQAGEIRLVGSPLKLSKTPVEINHYPPIAGEHTEDILEGLGYTKASIAKLKSKNIV